MNYQNHNSRPQTASDNCGYCHGTGWKTVTFESGGQKYSGMARCECRKATDAAQPGGFERAGGQLAIGSRQSGLDALLNETDRKIAALIEERKGQGRAISIVEIVAAIWPEEDPTSLAACQRSVKATVEKLRMLARMPIAATKRPPYGYYIPVTAEECDECYKRLFGEGVKLIMVARLFRPEADVVQELRGQLQL